MFRRKPKPSVEQLARLALDVANVHGVAMGRPAAKWETLHPSNRDTYLDVARVIAEALGVEVK